MSEPATTSFSLDERTAQALLQVTPSQQHAAIELANGRSHLEAAGAAGVSRETVTRWAGSHPGFRSLLAHLRAAAAAEQLRLADQLRLQAMHVVHRALSADPPDVKVALSVLKILGESASSADVTPAAGQILEEDVARTLRNLLPPIEKRDEFGFPDAIHQYEDEVERAVRITISRQLETVDNQEEAHEGTHQTNG